MATLAFSLAGQAVGGLLGGPIGATVGRALGALAGSVVDNALFGESAQQASGPDVRLQGSREGGAIPRLYGWNRVSGNIIWATELERQSGETAGSKGTSNSPQEDVIAANFAVAFCEGEVSHFGRMWADGQLLDTDGLNIRFYRGSETQNADGLIVAKQGATNSPAYRGLCYAVFEQLPLTEFGNRIPQISVEICRAVGDLEKQIKAITLIPSATEYGYDPTPRVRVVGPGASAGENTHVLASTSDWTLSLDELQAICPNLEHVALVVAWFGNDLRCGNCAIEPRVENATKQVQGQNWSVSGISRASATVMTTSDGGPAYGGTPADSAVMAAIADLKARGVKVTFYPIVLMDIAAGNSLTDPNTLTSGQSAYPWRGRITCAPAPGVVGTVDQTGTAATQVAAFVGSADAGDFAESASGVTYTGGAELSYRRMVLHYAHLCHAAGGVDAFLLGSELRGLTQVRSGATTFPFVNALMDLADDVRSVVGAGTKLTYAADWSEYHGYQPANAPGDKLFHLDLLWAHDEIDAIGIDNYMPIADWRDGTAHADAELANSIYALDYLSGNIALSEGFDWYYASDADRADQTRTPISDGAYGEPFVWRVKDIAGWWSNAHHNRIGGVRQAGATGWVPQSKPIWFTELGCGAVDKGANLPSAFADPKSAENALPHFSSGAPDMLMQRQFLRAHMMRWLPDGDDFQAGWNPESGVYTGHMVDPERLYLWTWDARPYPAFPGLTDVWADGPNHATGHWLTGRLGAASNEEMLQAMAHDFDVPLGAVVPAKPAAQGVQVEGLTSFREATEILLSASRLALRDKADALDVIAPRQGDVTTLDADELARAQAALVTSKRGDGGELPGQFALSFQNRQRSFQAVSVTAMARDGTGQAQAAANFVTDSANARIAAENLLSAARQAGDVVELALPPSMLALEVGDAIEIEGRKDGPATITQIRDGLTRRVTAEIRSLPGEISTQTDEQGAAGGGVATIATPLIYAAHVPADPGVGGPTRLMLGALATPWPGPINVLESTGADVATLQRSATLGETQSALQSGAGDIWDRSQVLTVKLFSGHLASAEDGNVLAGSNRLLVEHADGIWEIIGFAEAELVDDATYDLRGLLRGLEGTGPVAATLPEGSKVMRLDGAIANVPAPDAYLGGSYILSAHAGARDLEGTAVEALLDMNVAAPLAPAHLHAMRGADNDIAFDWIRRSRLNGNVWALAEVPLDAAPEAYRVTIFDDDEPVRVIDSTVPSATYSAVQQIADFGMLPETFTFHIAQISAVHGAGTAAIGVFNG